LPKAMEEVEARVRAVELRLHPDCAIAAGVDDRDLVLLAVEADLGARDVVDDDRVEPLALELPSRARDEVAAVLGGEADQRLTRLPLARDGRERVLRRL